MSDNEEKGIRIVFGPDLLKSLSELGVTIYIDRSDAIHWSFPEEDPHE